jgi:hypothetical protein
MANLDAPRGFSPVRHLHGGTIRYEGGFTIASAYNTAIYSGDLVSLAATRANQDIALTADGAAEIIGVFAGCQYTAADGSVVWSPFWVASTATLGSADAEAFVYADPGIVYEAQADGTLAVTAAGQFADMVSTHAGSAVTGRSGEEIQASSISNDILQVKVLGLTNKVDGITPSEAASDWSRWECIIAEGERVGTLRSVS